MARIEIQGDKLVVEMLGWDKLLCLRSSMSIPLSHLRELELRPKDADPAKATHALRLAGGYWPHAFATGYFAVNGEIVFYDVHDASRTISIGVEHESVRRLILEVEGETPEQAIAKIQGAMQPR